MAEIGPKRHRLQIQRRTAGRTSFKQQLDQWTPVATVWGRVRSLSAREVLANQQVRPEATLRVEIRYRADLTSADRLVFRGRVLKIVGIWCPDERFRELYLDCSEWQGAGDGQ